MSHVTFFFLFFFWLSCAASRCRVCFQRGLLVLVSTPLSVNLSCFCYTPILTCNGSYYFIEKGLSLQNKAKDTFHSLLGSVSLNVMKNTYLKTKTCLIPPNYFQAIGTKTRGVELIAGKSYLVGRDPLVCFYWTKYWSAVTCSAIWKIQRETDCFFLYGLLNFYYAVQYQQVIDSLYSNIQSCKAQLHLPGWHQGCSWR